MDLLVEVQREQCENMKHDLACHGSVSNLAGFGATPALAHTKAQVAAPVSFASRFGASTLSFRILLTVKARLRAGDPRVAKTDFVLFGPDKCSKAPPFKQLSVATQCRPS